MLSPNQNDIERLQSGRHGNPHAVLGAHPWRHDGTEGVVIRAMHHASKTAFALVAGQSMEMTPLSSEGLWGVWIPNATLPLDYRIRWVFDDGAAFEQDDPYRFLPTLGDVDLHLFGEGCHRKLWQALGAHVRTIDGIDGVSFAVWAPNAVRVSVVGDFCDWDGRRCPMRQMGSSGVFELFIPGIGTGTLYKYEILTRDGHLRIKSDPMAQSAERSPGTASRVFQSDYTWQDGAWMASRPERNLHEEPMLAYEAHLGSWARVPEDGNRPLTYREIAPRLVEHVKKLGFTHIELMAIAEHPFEGSWGYQVSYYYAPTARFGTPDDFRYFVDYCHQAGIGVILDWVPGHFPKDDFALRWFDGTPLYEHADPRLGEHPDWGTLIFNFGRHEVRNFLTANALYWLDAFHVDGLRIDAVASMLYRDYSRKEGQWLPNPYGGRENLEAIDFLKETNELIRMGYPGCFSVAEESTSFAGVSRPVSEGGLGFTFKWNMGWMHDTLEFFKKDPVHRRYHLDQLTFAMIYEYSERFVMPLSHDEVVHGKRSLLEKMPGDPWQKLANLRLLMAYLYTRPGKKLLFMGTELAPYDEWNHDHSLPWHLADEAERKRFLEFMRALGCLYHDYACLWKRDHAPDGFRWIGAADHENSTLVYARHDGSDHLLMAINLTPVPREHYRVGAPAEADYDVILSSDDPNFGGSGWNPQSRVHAENEPWHGCSKSLNLNLPPLGALILRPARP